MNRQEFIKAIGAAVIVAVLLGSKLVGPANVCGSDAGANSCNSPQSSSANKIPGSAWVKGWSPSRPL